MDRIRTQEVVKTLYTFEVRAEFLPLGVGRKVSGF